jgi:glycogen debranching enzyme
MLKPAKVNSYGTESHEHALNLLSPFFTNGIHQACLGTIGEIYDCDLPNTPRGCVAQAWSVAEPLRAYVENILEIKPKYIKEILKT